MLTRISDENDLIERVSQNDSEALQILFDHYLPMVRNILTPYHLRIYDDDDWYQEARWVCYRACCTYRSHRGSVFSSYYRCCLQNKINSILRKELALKRCSNHGCISLDDELQHTDLISECDPHESHQLNETLQEYQKSLSNYEAVCFQVLMGTISIDVLLQQTNTTVIQAQRGMDRCRIKFRRYLKKRQQD